MSFEKRTYRLELLKEITGCRLEPGSEDEEISIGHLLTDSRKIIHPEQTLFCAIKTDRNDGHLYINDLQKKGVKNFIVSKKPFSDHKFNHVNYLICKDTLNALQKIAAHHRSKFKYPVVAITGSNGKTIVKEWLFQLLNPDLKIIRSPKSYNSQIGVPLSLWEMELGFDMALIEAGISFPGEMKKLESMIKPDIGIITNIGAAHDENFVSIQQKANEKLILFKNAKKLFFCADHTIVAEQIRLLQKENPKLELLSWSLQNPKEEFFFTTKRIGGYTTEIILQDKDLAFQIPFIDRASVENACHCCMFLMYEGLSNQAIMKRMKSIMPVAMRLELKEGVNNCSIINDSYNSDLTSVQIAIDFLNQQQKDKKTLIISDIMQSGLSPDVLYKKLSEIIEKSGIQNLIGIGSQISRFKEYFRSNTAFYTSTEAFLESGCLDDFSNEVILLKGARVFTFEKISRILQKQAHDTVLEVDLNALIHNLNFFRSRAKSTKIMAMVKAFSYGSGTYEIANTLQFHNIDYLAVAYTDEGVQLRQNGIHTPIMVMNPERQSLSDFVQYNLEPEIYSLRLLNQLLKMDFSRNFKIHLKFDTGMHRLGFFPEEAEQVCSLIKKNKKIQVASVFSHLAAADEEDYDHYTIEQIKKFKGVIAVFQKHFSHKILYHICNSAGILRFNNAHFDMVRLGIGLYGISHNKEVEKHLVNVSKLTTIISQIKNISINSSVGYSRKGMSEKERKIAVIPVGYADGLRRGLGQGNFFVKIRGMAVKTVGNICMDMCMLDVTGVPVKEGDPVVVFNTQGDIKRMADALDTIPYEILTSVSGRVKRVFYYE